MGWFDRDESNSNMLALCLASDAASVRSAIADRICTIVQNISLLVTAIVIAFFLDWRVACVTVSTFPLLIAALVGEVMIYLFLLGMPRNLTLKSNFHASFFSQNMPSCAMLNSMFGVCRTFSSEDSVEI